MKREMNKGVAFLKDIYCFLMAIAAIICAASFATGYLLLAGNMAAIFGVMFANYERIIRYIYKPWEPRLRSLIVKPVIAMIVIYVVSKFMLWAVYRSHQTEMLAITIAILLIQFGIAIFSVIVFSFDYNWKPRPIKRRKASSTNSGRGGVIKSYNS
jgi:hypothetical protein